MEFWREAQPLQEMYYSCLYREINLSNNYSSIRILKCY